MSDGLCVGALLVVYGISDGRYRKYPCSEKGMHACSFVTLPNNSICRTILNTGGTSYVD